MTRIRAFTATTLVVITASLLPTAPAQAEPGDLDPTFSGDGKELTSIRVSDYGRAVAIQADGKIVVVGGSYAGAGGAHDFAVARYNPDGSLDTTFSGDGKETTGFGGGTAHGVAIQLDGNIVAVGDGAEDGAPAFALARYNPDGSLDKSFAGDGTVTTDFPGGAAYSVALRSDGKIVAMGSAGGNVALARYNPDGSLDTSFDGDGTLTTDFGGGWASRVALQPDGKIVAVGRVPGFGGEGDFAAARYKPDGTLDTSFAGDGMQTTDLGADEWASDVAIQADGKIVAVGSSYSFVGSGTMLVVARYNADGSLDPNFGGFFAGMQFTSISGTDTASGVTIEPGGKVVAVGTVLGVAGQEDFLLARYNSNGSPDATFSDDGTQTTDFGGSDGAGGVAVQPDGKIVAAGAGGVGNFAIARYQSGLASGTAPANSTPPTISGTASDGQTLTVNRGAWTGSTPIDHSYQWRRCDSAGAGCLDTATATATTYALAAADVGHMIRVRETASNAYGQGAVDSAATAVVTAWVGAIAGRVRSARAGTRIASASVNCSNGYSATTASDGNYSIPKVTPGSYSCTATAERYAPSTQTVTVASGKTTTANFNLVRS